MYSRAGVSSDAEDSTHIRSGILETIEAGVEGLVQVAEGRFAIAHGRFSIVHGMDNLNDAPVEHGGVA